MSGTKTIVLNKAQIATKIERMVHEIHELCYNDKEIILCAVIPGNGLKIATRIAEQLTKVSDITSVITKIELDKENPLAAPAKLELSPSEYEGKTIVIIDDVSNSGKTLMCAIKHFMDRPIKSILPLVLVDRDHSRYPVKNRFVGLTISTTLQNHIHVDMNDSEEAVYLL